MQKGITKEIIFKESEKIVKAQGFDGFSVRLLSAHLGIKPASLYNHIEGINEIYCYLAKKAADMMIDALNVAINDKSPDEAFISAARAYRSFAEKKREYYLILIRARSFKDEKTSRLGYESFKPIISLIDGYGLESKQKLNFVRSFRSFLHGFVEITHNGFMQKGNISKDETFECAVKMYLEILKGGAKA